MRHLLCALLFISTNLMAQTETREKIDSKSLYEFAIRNFMERYPQSVGATSLTPGKVLFVKYHDYITDVKDTINGVKIVFADPEHYMDTLAHYLSKKQKLYLLDVQKILMKDFSGNVWVTPMEMKFDPKKKKLDLEYEDKMCEYVYGYSPEREKYYWLNEIICKEVK